MSYIYCFICLIILASCGGSKQKSDDKTAVAETVLKDEVKYVSSIKLLSPEKNRLYNYNDELKIVFENKEKFPVDSAQFFYNSEKIGVGGKDSRTLSYRIPESRTGNNTIKIIAYHPENKRGVATVPIRVKPDKAPDKYTYEVTKVFPHDTKAYTQGLVYHDGFIYEGTGKEGESTLRKTNMATGDILSVLSIDNNLFGEGVTIYKDKIYQITWTSRKGFVYDLKTFTLESTFNYNSEGWGITTAGDKLIMSDGSNKLYHITPSNFNIIKQVEVYDNNGPVQMLNELEYVDGLVWANVWLTDRIVAIDPETGAVKGELDMSGLLKPAEKAKINDKDDVLNGIAHNPEKDTYYLTGKRWPKLFEIKIKH